MVDVVKLFVKLGVNLNEQDWFGRTALHWAGLCENASLVEYLVERGGDLTIRTLVCFLSILLCRHKRLQFISVSPLCHTSNWKLLRSSSVKPFLMPFSVTTGRVFELSLLM